MDCNNTPAPFSPSLAGMAALILPYNSWGNIPILQTTSHLTHKIHNLVTRSDNAAQLLRQDLRAHPTATKNTTYLTLQSYR